MASDKPQVPANPTLIEWPSDPEGVTSALKKELLNTGSRMNGNEARYQCIMQVLRTAAAHFSARIESQKQEIADRIEWEHQQALSRPHIQSGKKIGE